MASRSSMGVGAGVAIALLSIITLTLFILSVVFYGKYKDVNESLAQTNDDFRQIINAGERNGEKVRRLTDQAQGQGRNTTLVGYLTDELENTMSLLVGDPNFDFERLQAEFQAASPDATGSGLLNHLKSLRRQIVDAEESHADQEAALEDLRARLDEELQRFEQLENRRQDDVAAMQRMVGTYGDSVQQYDVNLRDTIDDLEDRLTTVVEDYENQLAALRTDIEDKDERAIILQGQLTALRREASDSRVRPRDEYALVDATVLSANAANQTIIVDRGRRHNVVLGMNFEVYTEPSVILARDTGEMLRGKATAEIIAVEDQTSSARVVRYSVANPVLEGDVCVNPIYDPNKKYRFLVYGEFDTDFDGRPTNREADDIRALIEQWGGIIVDSVEDNVDYLVLGARPYVGPPPGHEQPFPIIAKWQEDKKKADRYDQLFATAEATSIPILNQNRLFTLIGYFER